MNKELIDLLRKHVDMWREIDQLFLRAESTQLADKAADALEAADKRIVELRGALNKAVWVAWDGPPVPVGTNCAETYTEWRDRLEKECREALKEQVDG